MAKRKPADAARLNPSGKDRFTKVTKGRATAARSAKIPSGASKPGGRAKAVRVPDSSDVLLIVLVKSADRLPAVLTGLSDTVGFSGMVTEARGMLACLQREVPIFAGLASMIGAASDGRIVLCTTTSDRAQLALNWIASGDWGHERPIALTVPIARMVE